jgi:signal peptidase I
MHPLKRLYLFFADTIQTLVLAALIFGVIYLFLFRPFQVSGESMYPTFQNKEYILTNLISLRFEDIKRGDVIVFKSPTDREKDFIKRVIALPGDSIELKNGYVYINGKQRNEQAYLGNTVRTFGGSFLQEGTVLRVPDDSLAVMGDNRRASSDFREWGFLKKEDVIGKSIVVYWPLNHMRIVKNPFNE